MDNVNEIYVYENWKSDTPSLIGTLYVDGDRGKQIVSFEYDDEWLNDLTNNVTLDPDLRMFKGRQYTSADKLMFGVFEDSCPDRWGRLLMKRREAIIAKKEERKPRTLAEVDFLIGVYDETRMGGLRFSTSKGGPFISDDKELATPPWTTLRKLELASLAFEKNDDGMEEKWLKQLVAPGASLGGARPKATVVAPDGSLWIAKFPSKYDEINVGAWEMVVHDLAVMCNLNVPEAKLENFSKTGSTFLENALIKARAVAMLCDDAVLADDSGLCVDALDGRPGVYSARYGGDIPHSEKMKMLLSELEGKSDRKARFECVTALVLPDGREYTFKGTTYGRIMEEEKGENGFGFDPVFYSDELKCGFAECSDEEKNSVSHRGKALFALKEKFSEIFPEKED